MPDVVVRVVFCTLVLTGVAGCAVVQSDVVDDSKATPAGLVYYMPRRPFVVTVSTPSLPTGAPAGAPAPSSTVAVAAGAAEADLAQRFVLSQGVDVLAKTELNITVGANGLLKTSNSTSTSEVITALQNAASAAGTLTGLAGVAPAPMLPPGVAPPPPPPTNGCPPPGTNYQYLVYPGSRSDDPQYRSFCGFTVSVHLAAGAPAKTISNSYFTAGTAGYSGVFYRHELPYVVTVTGPPDAAGHVTVALSVLTSPDDSEIDFFPVRRSFFANNTANISFTDGVLTGVDQTTEGELTAALSAPAAVVTSYTTAGGALFTNVTSNSADLQKLLAQQQATDLAKVQNNLCQVTIASNPLAGLDAAGRTAALAAITAACPH